LVGEANGRVVGFVAGGPDRDAVSGRGEILAIHVLPRMQFRGIGRALFLAAVDYLLLSGVRAITAWVLSASPSRRFFESLEGEGISHRSVRLGGKRLDETGYVWPEIRLMVPEFVLPLA
jgi:GNAT superfamily N-acetyltransferase